MRIIKRTIGMKREAGRKGIWCACRYGIVEEGMSRASHDTQLRSSVPSIAAIQDRVSQSLREVPPESFGSELIAVY